MLEYINLIINILLILFIVYLMYYWIPNKIERKKKEYEFTYNKKLDIYEINRKNYEKFVEEMENLRIEAKENQQKEVDVRKLTNIYFKMILSVPDEVVKNFKIFFDNPTDKEARAEIYLSLRKSLYSDLGEKTNIDKNDIKAGLSHVAGFQQN